MKKRRNRFGFLCKCHFGVVSLCSAFPIATLAATVNGRIVDSQTSQSLAGARVSISAADEASTDALGYFRLGAVPSGPARLSVTLADGETFGMRLIVPDRPAVYVEIDRARHVAPVDEDY